MTSQMCFSARHYLMGRFRGHGAAGIGRGPHFRPGATRNGGWGAGDKVHWQLAVLGVAALAVGRFGESLAWRFSGLLGVSVVRQFGESPARRFGDWGRRRHTSRGVPLTSPCKGNPLFACLLQAP